MFDKLTEVEVYDERQRYENRKKELEKEGRGYTILKQVYEPFYVLIELESLKK